MTETTLKKLFDDLKTRDADCLPGFQRVLRKPRTTAVAQASLGWAPLAYLAASVLLGVALCFSVFPGKTSRSTTELEQWATISAWSAPSDAILAENTATSLSTSSDTLLEGFPNASESTKNL
ncbi:MAG: hypothetical protein WCG66_06625 [bacterium]